MDFSVFDVGRPIEVEEEKRNIGKEMYDEIVNRVPQPYENYVDIYDFFDKLQELIRDLGLLADNKNQKDKIYLVEEYPDETYEGNNAVVYKIQRRDFFTNSTPFSHFVTKQRKPLQLENRYDIISNNIKNDFGYKFTNHLELEVFGTSLKEVHRTCRLLESIILKHKATLKKYALEVQYDGQTPLEYESKYFDRRLLSKSVRLVVVTLETYSIVSEEIKKINYE